MKKLFYILSCALVVSCTACVKDNNGHEYVDLGLSSGTLWATCNVGADSPENYGDYFAWGETEPKFAYKWETLKWYEGVFIKYCTDSDYGIVDNKTILELSDDAANANWGGDWRMPNNAELDELRNECTWTWEQKNGVNGCTVIGPNGNSIFLPAAGYRDFSGLYGVGSYGYYWSGSLYSNGSYGAYVLDFGSSDVDCGKYSYRDCGQSVRPVLP